MGVKNDLEKINQEKIERELKNKKFEEIFLENARKFHNLKTINLPKELLLNDVISYSKDKLKGVCYRGEKDKNKKNNGGMSLYGRGIYSTTNKNYAEKFGEVRIIKDEELPSKPLSLKSANSFNQMEYLICQEYNIRKEHLYNDEFNIEDLVKKMGYDGVTIGEDDNMIIVKYIS